MFIGNLFAGLRPKRASASLAARVPFASREGCGFVCFPNRCPVFVSAPFKKGVLFKRLAYWTQGDVIAIERSEEELINVMVFMRWSAAVLGL